MLKLAATFSDMVIVQEVLAQLPWYQRKPLENIPPKLYKDKLIDD